MTTEPALALALAAAGRSTLVTACRDLSGGCIHRVRHVTLADGDQVVVKTNVASSIGMLEEEAASLRALAATDTVPVPSPLATGVFDGAATLVMTAIQPGPADSNMWRRLGSDLASLHTCAAGTQYGFEHDNHLGATLQLNRWCDDWIEFNATHRLGYQVQLARDSGHLTDDERARIDRLIGRLHHWLPNRPHPSLLHGDLWSGNSLAASDGRIAVIDPACSIGDGWADIAMMRLFGGFSFACFDAYGECVEPPENLAERIAVYQLYHVLNHVNLFGRGYVGQAMELVRSLGE